MIKQHLASNQLTLQRLASLIKNEENPIYLVNNHPTKIITITNKSALNDMLEERKIFKEGIAQEGGRKKISTIEIVFDDIDHSQLSIWSDVWVSPSIQVTSGSYNIEGETAKIFLQLSQAAIDSGQITDQALKDYLNKQLIDVLVSMSQASNARIALPNSSRLFSDNDLNADNLYTRYYQNQKLPILTINTRK